MPGPASYRRYVALGDSQTEGLNDGDDATGLRGWADRFAEALAATTSPELHYANLAVRGCRAGDVRQRPARPSARTATGPGERSGRDERPAPPRLRRRRDGARRRGDVRGAAGDRLPGDHDDVPRHRPDAAGDGLAAAAGGRPQPAPGRGGRASRRGGAGPVPLAMCGDPALWSHDRIHGSREGHARIAAGMGELLRLPGSDGSWSVSAPASTGLFHAVRRDAWWAATFVVPFLTRQLLGRGPGTGRSAKRPDLMPVVTRRRPRRGPSATGRSPRRWPARR